MRMQIPFTGPDYASRSPNVNAQKTVNLWPRVQKADSKTVLALYSTPGLKIAGTAGSGPWRSNLIEWDGALYGVSGDTLYKLNSSLSASSIGTLSSSGGRVEIVAGRSYIMLVDGSDGYTYDGTTFASIADVDFPSNPTHCAFLDGRYAVNDSDSDRFYISAIGDPTSWGALDYASAESSGDDILAFTATYKDLYFLGSKTLQVYYNSGNPEFTFDPYPNGTIDIGIKAPHSLAKSSSGLFWLATTEEGGIAVVQCQGLQFAPISEDIAWDLEQFTVTDDATGFTYKQNGRTIYQISFPTEDKTFEYLVEDGMWVERKSSGIGRYRIAGHGYIGGKHVMADYENGRYYEHDFSTYLDDDEEIERIRRAQVIHTGNSNRMTHNELIIEFEAGKGLVTGQGIDPQAMLRYSDDGGHTWSYELWRSMGKIGEYSYRSRWPKLGTTRNRVYEVKVTDPIDVTIITAYARVTPCAS